MRNYVARYKTGSILLVILISLFMCTACSKKDVSENQSSESLSSTSMHETEKMLIEEAVSLRSEIAVKEPTVIEVNWESYFEGINGAAVVYRPSENSYQIYNQDLALIQRSPCSTFKIISSLIALENKIIEPDNSIRPWSGEVFWNEDWNKDIDFREAFRTSCVWYYRKIIDEIGRETIQGELDRLLYGNCDISDWEGVLNTNNNNRALTGFWIESSLKISPKEQVEVMERIFGENSIYSQESQEHLKQVMFVPEQQGTDTLIYGKTGMGKAYGIVVDSWYTGFADTADGRSYFCVYLGETEGENVSSAKAKEIAIRIITDMEMVP